MSDISSSDNKHDRPLLALAMRAGAMVALALTLAGVRFASQHGVYMIETMFCRQLFALPVVVMALMLGPGIASVKTSAFKLHVSRSAIGLVGMTLNFLAVILLPLAEATTLGFMTPVFATILSVAILREHVGWHRWLAVAFGFVGVLVIFRPGGGELHLPPMGIAVALMAAAATALITIFLRQMGRTEPALTTAFWFMALSVPPLALLMIRYAQPHPASIWLMLGGIGIMGGLAQILMTSALRYGPVSLLMPMDYSTLIWTASLGWLIWDQWPPARTWAGATVIAASGIYIAWREHKRLREIRIPRAPLTS